MIGFSRIKFFCWQNIRGYRFRELARLLQLLFRLLRSNPLFFRMVINGGFVGVATVKKLAASISRVNLGPIHFKQTFVRIKFWLESDFNRFPVPGHVCTDLLIRRIRQIAACISADDCFDAFE